MAIRAYYRMGAFSILSHYALLRSLRLRCPHRLVCQEDLWTIKQQSQNYTKYYFVNIQDRSLFWQYVHI